ncbi:MAG: glycoside hydrolase domain-containing protein, partial [Candidatus Poribacteria bacterium]
IGYDREIMKRTRKVLDRNREGCLIDAHSWNHFNDMAGWANCLNMYMEHLPYIDSLWIGEGFDYNESPDYWLVEISGIPFGLFSEMLEGGGNQWRGMLYGMTTRFPYSGDPRPIWKIWDDFGIQDAKMIGYWDKSCPIKTDNKDVLATAYIKDNKILVAIASWANEPVDCKLEIDWNSLNIDRQKAKIYAPAIPNFQEEMICNFSDKINIQPGKGWLLIISY